MNIGTPVSNRHYLGSPKGEIYGLDHTSDRFSIQNNALLRPKTDIPSEFACVALCKVEQIIASSLQIYYFDVNMGE